MYLSAETLKNIATKVVKNYSYEKELNEFEMQNREQELGQAKAEYDTVDIEFKGIAEDYKNRLKPLAKNMERLSEVVRTGIEEVTEDCYLVIDDGKAEYYNIDGKLVYTRDASERELGEPANIFKMK